MNDQQIPPNNPDAERGLLGCLLEDPVGCIPTFLSRSKIGSAMFYELRHRIICSALSDLWQTNQPIDVITLSERLKSSGDLDAIGGITYLLELKDAIPSSANMPYYLEILLEYYTRRRLLSEGIEIAEQAAEGARASVGDLISGFADRAKRVAELMEPDSYVSISDLVKNAMEHFEKIYGQKGGLQGLPTGFPDLDRLTSGLKAAEMFVIAARPSMGKTSLAMNIADHVACDLKVPVGVFSLEMSKESLTQRVVCSRSRVNEKLIYAGQLVENDFVRMGISSRQIASSPLIIEDRSDMTILQIRAKAKYMHERFGVKLFMIDYLQLIRGASKGKNDSRERAVAEISIGCKTLAKELNVPIIVLAQLNREVEKDAAKRKPRLSDLRESGAIEQDADVVGMLYPEPNGDPEASPMPVRMHIAKHRNGPTGDIPFMFFKEYTRFESACKV